MVEPERLSKYLANCLLRTALKPALIFDENLSPSIIGGSLGEYLFLARVKVAEILNILKTLFGGKG